MRISRKELKGFSKKVLAEKFWPFFLVSLIPIIGAGAVALAGVGFLVNIFFVAPFRAAYCNYLLENSLNGAKEDRKVLWANFRGNYRELLENTLMRDIMLTLWSVPFCISAAIFVVGMVLISIPITYMISKVLYLPFLFLSPEGAVNNPGLTMDELNQFITSGFLLFMCAVPIAFVGMILFINKKYAYYMTDFIIGENPHMKWNEAIKTSKKMMKKWKFYVFRLELSFIGWILLSGIATAALSFVAGPFAIILTIIGLMAVSVYKDATVAQLYIHLKDVHKEIDDESFYCSSVEEDE